MFAVCVEMIWNAEPSQTFVLIVWASPGKVMLVDVTVENVLFL